MGVRSCAEAELKHQSRAMGLIAEPKALRRDALSYDILKDRLGAKF